MNPHSSDIWEPDPPSLPVYSYDTAPLPALMSMPNLLHALQHTKQTVPPHGCLIMPLLGCFSPHSCVEGCAVLSCSSRLFGTLWTLAHQAPLSVGFSRQEYCSGLPCPPPGDFPNPGIEPTSVTSPTQAGGFFTTSATWTNNLKLKGK